MPTNWSEALRMRKPVSAAAPYPNTSRFAGVKQTQARLVVKQAPSLLHSHLLTIVELLRRRLEYTAVALTTRITLARAIAFFTVYVRTTKRCDELMRTLTQYILRLPNRSGMVFIFQWGKTLREGANHLVTTPCDDKSVATCPVRAVEQLVCVTVGASIRICRSHTSFNNNGASRRTTS